MSTRHHFSFCWVPAEWQARQPWLHCLTLRLWQAQAKRGPP